MRHLLQRLVDEVVRLRSQNVELADRVALLEGGDSGEDSKSNSIRVERKYEKLVEAGPRKIQTAMAIPPSPLPARGRQNYPARNPRRVHYSV